jgi:hypothetical protein
MIWPGAWLARPVGRDPTVLDVNYTPLWTLTLPEVNYQLRFQNDVLDSALIDDNSHAFELLTHGPPPA